MKDGPTHSAQQAEHAVDLETAAVVGITVQDAAAGDTTMMVETLTTPAEQIETVLPIADGLAEVVGDKGYHSNATVIALAELGLCSCVPEPNRGRRRWRAKAAARTAMLPTGGGYTAVVGCACSASAANASNAPMPISTRRADCAACICWVTLTSSNAC